VARDEVRAMQQARESLEAQGMEVEVVSAGSTITTPYLSADDGITEVRPGTYVFNDLRTLSRYACTPDQIAVTMLATVVSRGPGRATLNTGSKSITTSRTEQHGHGHVVNRPRSGFSLLSEEHGVLDLAPEDEDLRVGDRVRILPIHICVWMDLHAEVYGVRAGRIERRIRVDAMRRSL
jgi:D-serine deaminase-like pyridoxal phosphate-dependent protein